MEEPEHTAREKPAGPRRLKLAVPDERAGKRVDFLLRHDLKLSGTVIRRIKWLEDGILLDGARVHTGVIVQPGQTLSVLVGDTEIKSGMIPTPGPLDIVYEDSDLLVLNKAPGVSVHPGPGHYCDTMGNFIMDYYKNEGVLADFHPVHRLDKGTSGLLLVAKHAHAQELLKEQLHTPDFRRIYLAVCRGRPESAAGTVDAPIGRAPGSLMERRVTPDGQEARTHYEVLDCVGECSLLRVELSTGRTHQIRVHMAYLGHPLIGDFLYGAEEPERIARPALHSAQLSFLHPISGREMNFNLPMPEDMARLLKR